MEITMGSPFLLLPFVQGENNLSLPKVLQTMTVPINTAMESPPDPSPPFIYIHAAHIILNFFFIYLEIIK